MRAAYRYELPIIFIEKSNISDNIFHHWKRMQIAYYIGNLCIWDQHATLAGTFSVIGAIISSSVYQQAPLRKTFDVVQKNLIFLVCYEF